MKASLERRIFQHFDMTINSRIIGAAAASPAAPFATPMQLPLDDTVKMKDLLINACVLLTLITI